ncbi:MAG: hypothetical protein COA50_00455 [Flavobacteriaceae bacterium]|nr:MAG: hypothetical protein COA50_00455 [Flavobacteriaceae bacterium]
MKTRNIKSRTKKSIRNRYKSLFYASAIMFLCLPATALAQHTTEKTLDSLYSNVLNEQRNIQIIFPEGYDADATDVYDVIYVVDGEWNTERASQIYQYATMWNIIPKNIVVGVQNKYIDGVNQRSRDLTPTHNESQPISGKADNFITFFKDELIPYINEKLPTTGLNTLIGASHGGTFAVYTLLKEPQLFTSYIAADPSLWWDDRYMSKLAAERLPELIDINVTLHISGRSGDAYEGMGIVAMDSVLKLKAPKGLVWESVDYPNETHNSVQFKSFYDGLKLAYRGYTDEVYAFHPMNGIVEKDSSFYVFRASENTAVHYTVDGTEPTSSSPKMEETTVLKGAAEFRAKAISVRDNDNDTAIGHFIEGEALKSSAKSRKTTSGGLNYAYYEGEWDKLPNFKKLKPVETGIANKDFKLDNLPSEDNFAIMLNGFFEIKENGQYTFAILSDDGSKFYLGDKLLMDHDGMHDNFTIQSYMLPLKTGFYPVRLEYFQKEGDSEYTLLYVKPGSTDAIPFPLELQYHK